MHSLSFDSYFDLDESQVTRTDANGTKTQVDGVYCGRSRFFKLAELTKLGEGAEAIVYDFPASVSGLVKDQVLKVFKRMSPTKMLKLSELYQLGENQPHLCERLVLPTKLLFDQDQSIAGYAMPRVDHPNLAEVLNALCAQKKPNYTKILGIFQQLSAFVESLHFQTDTKGEDWTMVIGDFNLANFLITPENKLVLIDTDGFGIRGLPVSMRGNISQKDREGQTVFQTSDYFQLYWNLVDFLNPRGGVQATKHKKMGKRKLETAKITIFHDAVINTQSTQDFIQSLPIAVRKDFEDVLIHGKRHPLKLSTLAALQEMYNPTPVVVITPSAKKPASARKKKVRSPKAPASSTCQPINPTPRATPKPVVKPVFSPVIDPKTKRAAGSTTLEELQGINYKRHFTSEDGKYFIFSTPATSSEYRYVRDVYFAEVRSGEHYSYLQLSVKMDALYSQFELLTENVESGYISFRVFCEMGMAFCEEYTYYPQTDLLLKGLGLEPAAPEPEPKPGIFSRAFTYLTTFDNNVATRSA